MKSAPTVVVLACAILALTTAGLGMLVTFDGIAPWSGIALCMIATAVALAWGEAVHLRRLHSHGAERRSTGPAVPDRP